MGHCLSCFYNQTNADVVTSPNRKENDVSENIAHTEAPNSVKTEFPQEEPLLQNNENHINSHKVKSISSQNSNRIGLASDNSADVNELQKTYTHSEKGKAFYHNIIPSIPRTMSSLGSSELRVSETKINQLFDQYKDSLEDAILAEGIENLCNDLQLDPDNFKVLVLAWKLNASQMCRFTRAEFTQGLKSMKTDSVKGIQQKLSEISNNLKSDSEQFKDLYRFTFKFGLDVSTGQRILPSDIAILLWRLVFTNNEPLILEKWLTYLEKNPHIRGIPKDTWNMFLNFCEFVGDDLSSYDDTEAWPSLFDDFVEFENDQMNQNVSKNNIIIQD